MEIGLKWVHMARYELILRLDGALWLRIIFKPLLTPKGAIKIPNNYKKRLKVRAKPAKSRDIMSSEPRHWTVFGRVVMAVQCYAANLAKYCPVLDSGHIMSIGIKSCAAPRTKYHPDT